MTKEEKWLFNLGNFGTDVEPDDIQRILDDEHAACDPMFAGRLAKARAAKEAVRAYSD